MAKVKEAKVSTGSLREKITSAISKVKAKADYKTFPSKTATQTITVKAKDGSKTKVSKTGTEAQVIYYGRRYSILGTKMKNAPAGADDKAVAILKSFGSKSGKEQASSTYSTLEALMAAYGSDGKGGSKKLSEDTKVEFEF